MWSPHTEGKTQANVHRPMFLDPVTNPEMIWQNSDAKCVLSPHHLKNLKFLYSSSPYALINRNEMLALACEREQRIPEIGCDALYWGV